MEQIISWVVSLVGDMGYVGIFVMMFLESSFFPFPSEVAMVPAGYLVSKGEMHLFLAWLAGAGGSLMGALFNYFLGHKLGRRFLERFGHYLFLKEDSLKKVEDFFEKYGPASTFWGRLIPGIRQYISLPAGIGKMRLVSFTLYTFLGAGIWCGVLLALGYFVGENEAKIKEYLHIILVGVMIVVGGLFFYYYKKKKKTDNRAKGGNHGSRSSKTGFSFSSAACKGCDCGVNAQKAVGNLQRFDATAFARKSSTKESAKTTGKSARNHLFICLGSELDFIFLKREVPLL